MFLELFECKVLWNWNSSAGDELCDDQSMASCRTGPEAAGEEIPGLRHTVWDQQDQKVQYPKLQKDVSADVVVVGAGIAGLSVAYNLVKEGKKVIVLEARVIGENMNLIVFADFSFFHCRSKRKRVSLCPRVCCEILTCSREICTLLVRCGPDRQDDSTHNAMVWWFLPHSREGPWHSQDTAGGR